MTHIIDSDSLSEQQKKVDCDICVVGAGAAGIYLAVRLANQGFNVVLLEAGSEICTDGESVNISATFEGIPYRGATGGRFFGLGGSTSRWGGVVVPYLKHDLRDSEFSKTDPWQHIVKIVEEQSTCVLEMLGLDVESPYLIGNSNSPKFIRQAVGQLQSSGIDSVEGQFLPFRRKNLSFLLKKRKNKGCLTIYLKALAQKWELKAVESKAHICTVTAVSGSNEKTIKVSAKHFVVATGALESARVLLEIEQQNGGNLFKDEAGVGRYLGDHLSCSIAMPFEEDFLDAASLFAPYFSKGIMRSFRFLIRNPGDDLPRAFGHFIFHSQNPGFQLAKKVFTGLQSRQLPALSALEIAEGLGGVTSLAWHRFVNSRLFINPDTPIRFQLDIEQHPSESNGIRLSNNLDRWGRPVPIIKWEVNSKDFDSIRAVSTEFLCRWSKAGKGLPRLRPIEGEATSQKPHDAYHPVGVCRMGTDPKSVVDFDLRTHEITNLNVLSTAVFPSAGTANPTFSMLCLGEALSIRLSKELE